MSDLSSWELYVNGYITEEEYNFRTGNLVEFVYEVRDIQTQQAVKTFSSRKAARNWADKKDQEYGACRYVVQAVQVVRLG